MKRGRPGPRTILVVACACLALLGLVPPKYYFWPKRFRVVEQGRIYRGGWQTPRILEQLLQRYRIKTLLNVACNPGEREAAGEGKVVRELGVAWHKILMPGTGLGTFDQLDEAADVLAEPSNWPVFIHCAAGVHRTNMSIAAYRIKCCHWRVDEALDEMVHCGFVTSVDTGQAVYLREYAKHLEK